MNLKRTAELYKNPNPIWDNLLFNRLMNQPKMQRLFIESEIDYRKENSLKEILKKGCLSMKDGDTSIILADTQVLEKCISILKSVRGQKDYEKTKKNVVELLEMEIKDIEGLEKELQSEESISVIEVNKIIIG